MNLWLPFSFCSCLFVIEAIFISEQITGCALHNKWSFPFRLSWVNVSKYARNCELTGPKIQAKISSPSGDYVLGEGQLHNLPLMVIG